MVFVISSGVLYAKKKEVINKDKISYLLLEAQRLEQLSNPDSIVAAFEILNRVSSEDVANQDALFKKSPYYLALNMPEEYYYSTLIAAKRDTTNYYYNIKAAENAIKIEDYQQAISIYKTLLRNNPNDESLYSHLADAYIEAGEIDSAMICYDNIERMTENIEYVAISKSEIYSYFNEHDKAIAELKRLCNQYPTNTNYILYLADKYLTIDSLEQGKIYLDRAKELGAGCMTSVFDLEYYKRIKNADSVYISMEEVINCPDLEYVIKKEEIREYISLLLNDENLTTSQSLISQTLSRTDNLFKSLIDEYPRESYIRELYAEVLQAQERYKEAVEQCQTLLYLNPTEMRIHRMLIRMLVYNEDYEAMNKAVENAAQHADSTFVIESASYYYATKQKEKAIEMLKDGAEKYKSSPIFLSQIYSTIADIYFSQKKYEFSEQYYKLALEYNPNNILLLNNYAYYLAESGGDLSYAEKISARTINSEPNNPTYLDTYAWIYFKQGKYLFAELYIRKALENGGIENFEILEHYGDILYHQDKKEEAVKYWEKALEALQDVESEQDVEVLKQKIETKTYIAK